MKTVVVYFYDEKSPGTGRNAHCVATGGFMFPFGRFCAHYIGHIWSSISDGLLLKNSHKSKYDLDLYSALYCCQTTFLGNYSVYCEPIDISNIIFW